MRVRHGGIFHEKRAERFGALKMETNDNLTMDQDAWREGFRAAEEGKAACPYPARSREAWSWQSGFVEGIARSVRNLKPEADPPPSDPWLR